VETFAEGKESQKVIKTVDKLYVSRQFNSLFIIRFLCIYGLLYNCTNLLYLSDYSIMEQSKYENIKKQ